jgi:hypothetical protein
MHLRELKKDEGQGWNYLMYEVSVDSFPLTYY